MKSKYSKFKTEIKDLIENKNYSLRMVSNKLNIPRGSILYICKIFGIKTLPNSKANNLHFSKEVSKETLIDLYIHKQYTISKICKELLINRSTVHKYLVLFNIPRKPKGSSGYGRPWNYKGGKPKCEVCDKQLLNYDATRCQKHAYQGERNSMFGIRLLGEKAGGYIDGRTPLVCALRKLKEYKDWRKYVFNRDNYTCQECFCRGGNLEVDHINTFKAIFDEFLKKYDQFSPIEDKETLLRLAIKYLPFWDVNNGRVLCKKCHRNRTIEQARKKR